MKVQIIRKSCWFKTFRNGCIARNFTSDNEHKLWIEQGQQHVGEWNQETEIGNLESHWGEVTSKSKMMMISDVISK